MPLKGEKLIPLKDALELFPETSRGRRPSYVSLLRWARDGVCGVRLEGMWVGNRIVTSREAVERFLKALNPVEGAA